MSATWADLIDDMERAAEHDLPDGLIDLLETRMLLANVQWQEYAAAADMEYSVDLGTADAVTSARKSDVERHAILFDIDVPATLEDGIFECGRDWVVPFVWSTQGAPSWLIPSSTEGHSHLYVDCDLPWEVVLTILRQFTRAGVVEPGYLAASEGRGFTALRLPWIKKETA